MKGFYREYGGQEGVGLLRAFEVNTLLYVEPVLILEYKCNTVLGFGVSKKRGRGLDNLKLVKQSKAQRC